MAKKFFTLTSEHFILLVSFYFAFVLNNAFWDCVEQKLEINTLETAVLAFSLPLFVFIVFFIFFNLIVLPAIGKGLVIIMLLCAAAVDYTTTQFENAAEFNTIYDYILTTDIFFTPQALFYEFIMGGLPAIAVGLTKITYAPFPYEFYNRLFKTGCAISVIIIFMPLSHKEYADFFHKCTITTRQLNH